MNKVAFIRQQKIQTLSVVNSNNTAQKDGYQKRKTFDKAVKKMLKALPRALPKQIEVLSAVVTFFDKKKNIQIVPNKPGKNDFN